MSAAARPFWIAVAAVVACGVSSTASAQGLLDPGPSPAPLDEAPEEYTSTVGPMTPTEIIQQKAQIRAADRLERMASQKWYGFTPSRPRMTATPYSALYGPQYRGRVLGRPSAFFPARSLVIVR